MALNLPLNKINVEVVIENGGSCDGKRERKAAEEYENQMEDITN